MKRFLYLVATDQLKGAMASTIKPFLQILSWPYHIFTTLKRFFYDVGVFKKHRLSLPVMSIGNLTVGGTGKTPLVKYLIEALQKKGIKVVILTRGYMREGADSRFEKSDEAAMLRNAFHDIPVLVGANRVKNAQTYLASNRADVFLLDDGFQHQRLARDIDIIVIDATNPWGNGFLLPRGTLRESKNALKDVPIFVLTKTDFGRGNVREITNDLISRNPKALIVEAIHKPVSFTDARTGNSVDLGVISKKQVCAICSIGNPDSFVQTLTGLEANIGAQFVFIDHHIYMQKDIERVAQSCRDQKISTIVTTEKDAVKLEQFWKIFPFGTLLLSLKIQIMITGKEESFLERIDCIL